MRTFHIFSWKEANFRIAAHDFEAAAAEIRQQRELLGNYIERCPEFCSSLVPLKLLPGAPEIVVHMHQASLRTGVGPMAAVAGAVAQKTATAILRADPSPAGAAKEAIVENGGDIYLALAAPATIALYAGKSPLSGSLALAVKPEQTPLAICSSSSTMGHSLSFGSCDLATVLSEDGALADAAATMACNSVKSSDDIEGVLARIMQVSGIRGAIIIKDDKFGMIGDLPELVAHKDCIIRDKITRAPGVVV